jgi:hypothetical protein
MVATMSSFQLGKAGAVIRPNYDGTKQECSEVVPTPEIQRLMTLLEKQITALRGEIEVLQKQLEPILTPEFPKDVGMDRVKSETAVGESLQQKIDSIEYLIQLVREVMQRIAL